MSEFHVDPSKGVAGRLTVPGDKSISHRALMLGAIAYGTTHIEGFLESEDCLATLAALEHLGVTVHRPGPGRVEVVGMGLRGLRAPAAPLDMRNAGTAMRVNRKLAPQSAASSTRSKISRRFMAAFSRLPATRPLRFLRS